MIQPNTYFSNQDSLQKALVHRSYCNEHPGTQSNERLEFLGDSVLSVIISERLYRLFPDKPEGELTSKRSFLVQTTSLAEKARQLHLNEMLLLSKGEEDMGGRNNPSLLANTFEAVLGSLFLDSGIEVCKKYLLEIFPDTDLTSQLQTKDPKSLLQEHAQALGWGTPLYQLVSSSGPDHAKNFIVSVSVDNHVAATGNGASKQKAETEAAKIAMAKLFPEG